MIHKAREDGEKGRITGGDAVHPGPAGQALMAASILKAMKFPSQVSAFEIAITDEKVLPKITEKNCKVGIMVIDREVIKVMRKDYALPFFPEQAKSILKFAPLLEEMNQYSLKVSGMKAGKYLVKLGGVKVAEYTDKELAAGVNLAGPALAAGPIADQVKDVVKAVTDKTNYFHDQIFSLMRANKVANNPDYEARMKKMPDLDAAIRKALEPRAAFGRDHADEVISSKQGSCRNDIQNHSAAVRPQPKVDAPRTVWFLDCGNNMPRAHATPVISPPRRIAGARPAPGRISSPMLPTPPASLPCPAP